MYLQKIAKYRIEKFYTLKIVSETFELVVFRNDLRKLLSTLKRGHDHHKPSKHTKGGGEIHFSSLFPFCNVAISLL